MDVCEDDQRETCGRHIFREADLAYLLIDGERMFPLAELLASLFSNTARTTLFTRMEKIKIRRHFCSADEIKLLKTVNGIHGSSAICTLIPETDVQKYCDVYIDRIVDIKLFSTTIRRTKAKNNISKIKGSKLNKAAIENSTSTAKNSESKSAIGNNVVSDKATRPPKGKRACRGKQKIKNGIQVPQLAKTSPESNHSQSADECSPGEGLQNPKSLANLAKQALDATQSLNHSSGVKARKKRKANNSQDSTSSQGNLGQNKKAKHADGAKESRGSRVSSLRKNNARLKADVSGNNAALQVEHGCPSTTEHPCGSSLSQCLTNANSEILFSDASSNDSGFASTTLSESLKRNKTSSPCLDLKQHEHSRQSCINARNKIASSLTSPSKLDKCIKKNRKARSEPKKDKHVNLNLSPPALVLKRQNNVWLVEEKSEQEDIKPASSKAKKKLKWTSYNGEKFQNQQKNTTNRKNTKKNTFYEDDEVKSEIQVGADGRKSKGKKLKRKTPNERCDYNSKVNVTEPNTRHDSSINNNQVNNTVKSENKSKNVTSNLQKTKKVFVSKTLKANKDFAFRNLFSSFPFLSVQDGDLSPSFSEVLPAHSKPPKSTTHPIWKWQRGKPVFVGRKPFVK